MGMGWSDRKLIDGTLPVTSFSSLSSLSWKDSSWYNVLAERFSFFVVDRPAVAGCCKWTGLCSLCGDVAWLICLSVSVSAERSIVWMLSNSFCSDGGPEPTVWIKIFQLVFSIELLCHTTNKLTWASITSICTAYRFSVKHLWCFKWGKTIRHWTRWPVHRMQSRSIQF